MLAADENFEFFGELADPELVLVRIGKESNEVEVYNYHVVVFGALQKHRLQLSEAEVYFLQKAPQHLHFEEDLHFGIGGKKDFEVVLNDLQRTLNEIVFFNEFLESGHQILGVLVLHLDARHSLHQELVQHPHLEMLVQGLRLVLDVVKQHEVL